MKTAEDIIISKRYFELNAAEKEAVKEYASNEEDYEAMRWFLISTGNEFAKEKIEPSADLRRGVMAHLNQKQTAPKTIWLNGVSAFLFPSEKKFFQYPAFQMAAVAAVVVAIVLIYNQNPLSDKQEMAINTPENLKQEEPHYTAGTEAATTDTDVTQSELADESNEQTIPDASKITVIEKESVAMNDEQASPALYYRDMAVAEEVKILEEDVVEYTLSSNISSGANSQQTVQPSVDGLTTLNDSDADSKNLKQDVSKKQSGEGKDQEKPNKNADLAGGTSRTGREELDNKAVPAGYVTTTTVASNESVDEDKSKNEGEFKTATAGGVFGDVTTESEIAEEKEESAVKYSITQTKMLKKLIFVVK